MPMYVGDNGEPFEARYIMRDNVEDIANWGHAPERFVRHNQGNYARAADGGIVIIDRAHFNKMFKEVE